MVKHFTPGKRSDRDRGERRSFSKDLNKNFQKDFKKDFRREGFGGKPRFGGVGGFRDRGDAAQFEAICANCGKTCQVPFRPNGKRPVYCKECFPQFAGKIENAPDRPHRDHGDRPPRDFPPRPSSNAGADTRLLETIITKLDRIISLLEKNASSAAPVASVTKSDEAAAPSTKKKPKKSAKKSE